MLNNLRHLTPAQVWRYVPQAFIGLFFMSAAFLKMHESFFGPHRFPLSSIITSWGDAHIGLAVYARLMHWMLPYADALAIVVIVCQLLAGLLLVLNYRVNIAGILIFFIQTNVYLAVYHQIELRNLNAEALWIAIYFFARPEMKGRLWHLMTYAISLLMISHLYGRITMFGDAFPRNFQWQFEIYTYLTMGSWPALKLFVVWLFSGKNAALMWAASWWIKLALALGLLTRYRLYAGAALLVCMFGVTLVWLNTFTCEGVFWVLILFLWLSHELELQRSSKSPPASLLP